MALLKYLKATHIENVRYMCCNIIDENKVIERLCKQEGMDVKFEYTMLGTPQHNGCFVWKFAMLFNHI